MKYYIQRAMKANGRKKWIGGTSLDLASDLEAMEALQEQCKRAERFSDKPSTTEFRILDCFETVISTYCPNVNKFATETAHG